MHACTGTHPRARTQSQSPAHTHTHTQIYVILIALPLQKQFAKAPKCYVIRTLPGLSMYSTKRTVQGVCLWKQELHTRWFKYDRDCLCVNKSQFVPVIFEPPCSRKIRALPLLLEALRPKAGGPGLNSCGVFRSFQVTWTFCLLSVSLGSS
jgi:hypothetical protein